MPTSRHRSHALLFGRTMGVLSLGKTRGVLKVPEEEIPQSALSYRGAFVLLYDDARTKQRQEDDGGDVSTAY